MTVTIEVKPEIAQCCIVRRRIPLLPRHRIFYCPGPYVNNNRFVHVWRSTWTRLPMYARRLLLAHWRTLPLYDEGYAPSFFCVPGALTKGGEDQNCIAWFRPFDGSTQYLADAVNIMPDEILATLIAHELAHPVYSLVRREKFPDDFHAGTLCLKENQPECSVTRMTQEEEDVRDLNDGWGFSDIDFCQWQEENRKQLDAIHVAFEQEFGEFDNESARGMMKEEEIASTRAKVEL